MFISLGFASFENFLYIVQNGFGTALYRAVLAVPAHAFFGITMGSYIGLSKYNHYNHNGKSSKKYYFLSLVIPILLHGIYDFCVYSDNKILFALFSVFIVLLYVYSYEKIKSFSKSNKEFLKNDSINNIEIDFEGCQNCKEK